MSIVIYLLCAVTSLLCAVLLLNSYRERRVRLLLWSGLCFSGLALNNVLLVMSFAGLGSTDLSILRTLPALIGVALLIYGLIWDPG
jgi:hypothetical protein